MPIISERQGDNVIFTFQGTVNGSDLEGYFDTLYQYYQEIGNAMGGILDFRFLDKFTIQGMKIIEQRMKGVDSTLPVALLFPEEENPAIDFVKGHLTIAARGRPREGHHTNLAEAIVWMESWFVEQRIDRQAVRGQTTIHYTPPKE